VKIGKEKVVDDNTPFSIPSILDRNASGIVHAPLGCTPVARSITQSGAGQV
jgi:hypothetical protein